MRYLKTYRLFEEYQFDWDRLKYLVDTARKWDEEDFVEEYVYLNDINPVKVINRINKGDTVVLGRIERDEKGNKVYRNGIQAYAPYKTIIADKDWGDKVWKFIMDNTEEIQDQARKEWRANKDRSRPDFNKILGETVTAYHASPVKFDRFRYQEKSTSGQTGADVGFFFFVEKKNAEYYARVLADNHGKSYLYEVGIKIGKQDEMRGEDIGTLWGRQGDLSQAETEGFDTVLVKDADTGYGITDEIVVFDDDNIKITRVTEVKS